MAKKYYLVTFSGHNDPKIQGKRDHNAFRNLAPLLHLGQDVSRFAFYAGLGEEESKRVALEVNGTIDGYAGGSTDGITFIIHGYSAGGITALYFAMRIPDAQIVYIALADAAFYRRETDKLMREPGSLAYYLNENYYQTYENNQREDEIHDRITADGWKNKAILLQFSWLKPDYHRRAVDAANDEIFATMKEIISAGR